MSRGVKRTTARMTMNGRQRQNRELALKAGSRSRRRY